jgi:hypothetical protein
MVKGIHIQHNPPPNSSPTYEDDGYGSNIALGQSSMETPKNDPGKGFRRMPNMDYPGLRNRFRRPLGTRYIKELKYDDALGTMTPLLNKSFNLTWVLTDGLLFLGMLNCPNSPLNENVVTIWYNNVH